MHRAAKWGLLGDCTERVEQAAALGKSCNGKEKCISEVAQGHEHARLKPVRRPARVRDVGHSSAAGLGAGSHKALLPKKERAPRGGSGVHMPKRPGGGVEQPHAGSVLLVVSAGREEGVFPKSTKT